MTPAFLLGGQNLPGLRPGHSMRLLSIPVQFRDERIIGRVAVPKIPSLTGSAPAEERGE